MARKTFGLVLVAVVLAVIATPADAQFIGRTVTVAQLGACQNTKAMAYVTDATNSTTLGAGGGSESVFVTCASGSWAIDSVAAVSSLTGYLETSGTKAASISIESTGAGNDTSLIAADDVLLTPADALTVASGGAAAITTTAGAITLTAGGTTEDASIISTDDIFLTPDDALTAVAGGAVTLTGTAGTVAIAASAGAVTVTAVGATNDVTLTATDDVIFAPTDALTATVGGAAAITTTAGAIGLTAGGTTQDITLTSVDDVILAATDDTTIAGDQFAVNTTTVVVDAGGSADEITVAAGSTTVLGTLILPIASAPPAACAAGTKGAVYYDSDINKLCLCNATNYVLVNDDSTTTGCS